MAGISVATLTGDNGPIANAGKAKESSEIANENLLIKDKNYSVEDFDALAKTNFGYITNIYLKQEYEFHYDVIDYTFFVKQNDEVFAFNGNETNYNSMFLRS